MTAVSAALGQRAAGPDAADYTLEIAPTTIEVGPQKHIHTLAYNGQAPGPLLRMREGETVTIDVINRTKASEVVHWHGLFLPSAIDGAMEEGTPPIAPNGRARYTFRPEPAGFRWYHTHVYAGKDLRRGQYTGQHGCLYIEPRENPGRYDREIFLTLHDWASELLANPDGAMDPAYEVTTINGRILGFGDPLQVKQGEQVLFHILNASPTDVHWVALAGHQFRVVALDGNPVPQRRTVPMLRLAPAERVSALVVMNRPGVWILGEVRRHIKSSGMGIVLEYAGSSGEPQWEQPDGLAWDYADFASAEPEPAQTASSLEIIKVPLIFRSKFAGHGAMDRWTINGRSYPESTGPLLQTGWRYRLLLINDSTDDHPVHLHRHSFELRSLPGHPELHGIRKDVVLVGAKTQVDVEFVANHPGPTLFHCHQQNHMDAGFMMLLRYA